MGEIAQEDQILDRQIEPVEQRALDSFGLGAHGLALAGQAHHHPTSVPIRPGARDQAAAREAAQQRGQRAGVELQSMAELPDGEPIGLPEREHHQVLRIGEPDFFQRGTVRRSGGARGGVQRETHLLIDLEIRVHPKSIAHNLMVHNTSTMNTTSPYEAGRVAPIPAADAQRRTAKTWVKALAAVTYVVMIAVNALANALPINGRTTGGVSDAYPNLFAPAGLTFSIWGVIYLLLGLHVLYQLGLFRSGGTSDRGALLNRVGLLFSATSVANVSWILAWHYDLIGLSTVLLATMLVLLIVITRTILRADLSPRERLLVRLPFSVYFGWITVATIANITVWLVSVG